MTPREQGCWVVAGEWKEVLEKEASRRQNQPSLPPGLLEFGLRLSPSMETVEERWTGSQESLF